MFRALICPPSGARDYTCQVNIPVIRKIKIKTFTAVVLQSHISVGKHADL